MSHFDHDYAVFDEFGLLKLLCMRCGTVIAERRYAPVKSQIDPSKTIMAAIGPVKNSSFREVDVELSDGSYTRLKVCKGCENESINNEKAMAQIRRAHGKVGEFAGLEKDASHMRVAEKFKGMCVVGRLSEEAKSRVLEGGR